jgi:hypothetical protein
MASIPTGSHALLNTHYYDGKLIQLAKKAQQNLHNISDTKHHLFTFLRGLIQGFSSPYKQGALQAINLIERDIQNSPNHDHTNGVYADDILVIIIDRLTNSPEILPILTEQLHDIVASGTCAQGRCIRLLQILNVFI